MRQNCRTFTRVRHNLPIAPQDYKKGQQLVTDHEFHDNAEFFQVRSSRLPLYTRKRTRDGCDKEAAWLAPAAATLNVYEPTRTANAPRQIHCQG